MEEYSHLPTRLPRLKGKANFLPWFMLIKCHLEGKGLDVYVDGTEIPPVREKDEEDSAYCKRMEEWKKNNRLVITVILGAVDPAMIASLKSFSVAKDMLDHLEGMYYKPRGMSYPFSVATKFFNLAFDGKDIAGFCIQYGNVLSEAKQCKLEISDEVALYNFILRVSPYYPIWATYIRQEMRDITDPNELPSLQRVMRDVRDEDRFKSMTTAAIAEGKKGQGLKEQTSNKQSRTKATCHHCKKSGHKRNDCWELHPEKRPKQRR